MHTMLQVQSLSTEIQIQNRWYPVIKDISFELNKGEVLGIVGESGCGKSFTALSIMGLLPPKIARINKGDVLFNGTNLTQQKESTLEKIRGKDIGMIFQDPMLSLNPLLSIGYQIEEVLRYHTKDSKKNRKEKVLNLLADVGIKEPKQLVSRYPFQLSGGMLQRVVIATAIACNPQLLIADEPTTALDVTLQVQILELLKKLGQKNDMSMILISHDLGVVANTCDFVMVMYRGEVVEQAPVAKLFATPHHPYTKALLNCIPSIVSEKKLVGIPNTVPSIDTAISGCAFASRCPYVRYTCTKNSIPLVKKEENHYWRCIL